jgi:hypothetical protein
VGKGNEFQGNKPISLRLKIFVRSPLYKSCMTTISSLQIFWIPLSETLSVVNLSEQVTALWLSSYSIMEGVLNTFTSYKSWTKSTKTCLGSVWKCMSAT